MIHLFRLTAILILFFVLSNCTPIAKIIYGVKKPKVETDQSLRKFLFETGTSIDNLYVCKDSLSLYKQIKINSKIPEIEIFDCNGYFIPYKTNPNDCNAGIESFLEKIYSIKTYSVVQEGIQSRLINIVDCRTHLPVTFSSLPKSDYYILMSFTKYGGKKLNSSHVSVWINKINSLNSTNSIKSTVLLTSYDFMDFW